MGIQEFGAAVRKRREELGYSVEELAKKVGVQRNTIYEIERIDVKEIYISTFWAISRALNWAAEDAKRAYEGKTPSNTTTIPESIKEPIRRFLRDLPQDLVHDLLE